MAGRANPTTAALEAKVTKMEDGVATVCFATGMAAIGAMMLALLRDGDHVVSSQFLFGNTVSQFGTLSAHGRTSRSWMRPMSPTSSAR
jgi:O-acetylhomoserine (thiol)-lyase